MQYQEDNIFEELCPFNYSQGHFHRGVFVCSSGQLRSATAAHIAIREFGWNARVCGTHAAALQRLTCNLIGWAQTIVFVHPENFQQAVKTFAGAPELATLERKAVVWHINDIYDYMDPALAALVRSGMKNCQRTA
ncbi:MAG: hypothetical protein ACKO0Z_06245 [Betaproteobacteria bacterium]